jgi:hypothetical protein
MTRLPDFGDYVLIEQKRYVGDNEIYLYKVIGNLKSNTFRSVPVDARQREPIMGKEAVPVIRAICCGVVEDKVEKFRACDVELLHP